MATVELKVDGMTCQGCVRSVERKLRSVPGVGSATVDLGAGKASVEFDQAVAEPARLIAAVQQIGFQAAEA